MASRFQLAPDNPFAARGQHSRPRLDLRADRLRICADLPRQPGAQSRARRTDDARRISRVGNGLIVQWAPAHGVGGRRSVEPFDRRSCLHLPHAEDDGRDGSCGNPDDRCARNPCPRDRDPHLVCAAAVSGAGTRCKQSFACAVLCGRRCWSQRRSSSMARSSCSCASADGACACAPPVRTRFLPRSVASTSTAFMLLRGAFRH